MTNTRRTGPIRARIPRCPEALEPRAMLSGAAWISGFIASEAAARGAIAEPQVDSQAETAIVQSAEAGASVSSRWDWLAGTDWYVKTENLRSFVTSTDLSNPQVAVDETLWHIAENHQGRVVGTGSVKVQLVTADGLETLSESGLTFEGVVTPSGQVRIDFTSLSSGNGTTGIGQMRLDNGAWTIEMQMATHTDPIVTHWAYMTQLQAGQSPPDPVVVPPPDGNTSWPEWRWIEGTDWVIDNIGAVENAAPGVFRIDHYRGGFFWGSGTASEAFNVLGSITPEGNVLFLSSVNGADPAMRTGRIERTVEGGSMFLRTYDDDPAFGAAWTLNNPRTPSVRFFTASVQEVFE